VVFKRESIDERLKKLAGLYSFFELHKDLSSDELVKNLTVRLAVERASALAAEIIIDILSHILASEKNCFPETYEETIQLSSDKNLISDNLYKKIKGLGGYRNILVHEYLALDYDEVLKHFKKLIISIPQFQKEILLYMDTKKTD
jgi:uncharacterized protein YutE (UPF0331/DUF86 family)